MFIRYHTVSPNITWQRLLGFARLPSGFTPTPLHNGIELENFRHSRNIRSLVICFRGILISLILCKSGYYSGHIVEVLCFSLFMFLQLSGLGFHYSGNLTPDLLIPGLPVYFALDFLTISILASILSCGETLK